MQVIKNECKEEQKVAVVLFSEWDDAKDEARIRKYAEWSKNKEKGMAWWQKKIKEGVVKSVSLWSDNAGHNIVWVEFDSIDKFAKLWGDEEYHKLSMEGLPLVDNYRVRLMRPSI